MSRDSQACGRIKIMLGAYVLGGLRSHEEEQVTTHLARCARCRAEHEELAEVPVFLSMLSSEEAASVRTVAAASVRGESAQTPAAEAGRRGGAAQQPSRAPIRLVP